MVLIYASDSIQGDLNGWMNLTDPLDDALTFNQTGLVRLCILFSYQSLTFFPTGGDDEVERRLYLGSAIIYFYC